MLLLRPINPNSPNMKLSTLAALGTAIATTTLSTIAIAPIANAGTLITDSEGLVTSIEDLEIVGRGIFDVNFTTGSFDDIFDPTLAPGTTDSSGLIGPTFLGDITGAIAAAEAIEAALGDTFAIAASSTPISPSDSFLIPFEVDSLFDELQIVGEAIFLVDLDVLTTSFFLTSDLIDPDTGFSTSWATFTLAGDDPTPVPEPSAPLGLGLALGLSTLTRRKQNQ